MNQVTISGIIRGDFDYTIGDNSMRYLKFTLENQEFKPSTSTKEITFIKCISYGAVADYVNNEMYDGAKVVITGRLVHRRYYSNNTYFDKMYLNCYTVTRLEQEEYS